MKPVFQTIISNKRGDCFSAAIASLLELELDIVPHFTAFDNEDWFEILCEFLGKHGYVHDGSCWNFNVFKDEGYNIDGFAIASVPSRTYDTGTHAVVINCKGLVIHDPNPNKAWLYENIIWTGEFKSLHCIKLKENLK